MHLPIIIERPRSQDELNAEPGLNMCQRTSSWSCFEGSGSIPVEVLTAHIARMAKGTPPSVIWATATNGICSDRAPHTDLLVLGACDGSPVRHHSRQQARSEHPNTLFKLRSCEPYLIRELSLSPSRCDLY